MKPPTTYAEWAILLTELQTAPLDAEIIQCIHAGKLEMHAGVAERFTTRITELVNIRMERIANTFNQTIHRSVSDERILVTALRNMQKEFVALSEFIKMPALPEQFQKLYLQSIQDEVQKIQTSLERSACADRTGKLASIIRNNKLHV